MATDLIATFGGGGGEKPATSFNDTAYSYRDFTKPRGGAYNVTYTSLTDLVNISPSGGGYLESLGFLGAQGNHRYQIIIDGTTVYDETYYFYTGYRGTIVPPPPFDQSYNGGYQGYDTMYNVTRIRFDSSLRIRALTPSGGSNIYWNYYLT